MSREVGQSYIFLGDDYFFQDIIISGMEEIFLFDGGERVNLIMGVDKEDDILNNLNMNSLFNQKNSFVILSVLLFCHFVKETHVIEKN